MKSAGPAILTSPAEYVYRLVRTLVQVRGEGGADEIRQTVEKRIIPMLLEWNAMSFLPPPELLALYDHFLEDSEEPSDPPAVIASPLADFFSLEVQDSEGMTIASLIHEEIRGLTRRKVRQAVRARALAILCPSPRLPGSYVGNPADVRAAARDVGNVEGSVRLLRDLPRETVPLHERVDREWLALQARSWKTQEVREFLFSRLRPRRLKPEAVRGGVAGAVRDLLGALRGVVESRGSKFQSLEDLLEAVRTHSSGATAEAVLRRVRPIVSLHDPPWAQQELPLGGYSDLSTKGSFDRLLISNLAYPEEEFLRRVVEGELLFYELEAPPARKPPRKYVFLDQSPSTWGIPRLAAGAVALSLADDARERGCDLRVVAAGRVDRPFVGLDRASGVLALLDHQRWERDLASDLARLARTVDEESRDHPSGADVFVCTEAGRLEELRAAFEAAPFPGSARVLVFACDARTSEATLWRREAGAFVPAASLSLSPRELLPPPAEARPSALAAAIHPAFAESNFDFGANVTCAAIGPSGYALTGHDDGEVHAWDAGRGAHLGLRWRFARRITSAAASGLYAVVATDGPVLLDGREASVFHLAHTGQVVPVDARLDPRDENGLRAGWRSGQFFWFDREGVLVEHHAPEGTVTFHRSCRKAPGALFLVDQAAREVVWRDLRGSVSAFDLERVRDASDSPLVPHLLRPAHRVIADAGGRAVARMEGHDSIVEWVRPRTGGGAGVLRLPNAQRPMALDAGARRLLCANSNTIWFWSLDDQRLVRKNVSPSQEVTDLCLGNVAGQDHAGPVSAMRITGRTGAALLLRWAPEGPHRGIQVETFEDLTGERFTCSLDGSREQFIPARLFPGNSIADFRKGLRVGGMVVALVNSRLVEFRRAEDEQPFVRFWFRLKPALWAVASRDAAAGPGAGDLVAPGGGGFARDPHRLAGMLASGTRWNG